MSDETTPICGRRWIVTLAGHDECFTDEGEAHQYATECGGGIVLEVVSVAEVERLREERDEAIHWLRILESWGYGKDAPDLARLDWEKARDWLDDRPQTGRRETP